MKALGLFGLAIVLFAILILGPYVKGFTEGFADEAPKPSSPEAAAEMEKQTSALMKEIENFGKLLEDPNISSTTKEKIVKEKADKEQELAKLTGQPLPSAEPPKEGFEGILSTDLEKNSKATDLLQQATQLPL